MCFKVGFPTYVGEVWVFGLTGVTVCDGLCVWGGGWLICLIMFLRICVGVYGVYGWLIKACMSGLDGCGWACMFGLGVWVCGYVWCVDKYVSLGGRLQPLI